MHNDVYAPPGILVLDVSDPARPMKAAYLTAPEGTRYLLEPALSGTVLYVPADGFLWILDVSAPDEPREMARFTDVTSNYVAAAGEYVYVNDNNQRIVVLDVTDPSQPEIAGTASIPGTGMTMKVHNGYLLVVAEDTLLTISPEPLEVVNRYAFTFPDGSQAHVFGTSVQGDYLYAAMTGGPGGAIAIVDLSDPAAPHETDFHEFKGRQISPPVAPSTLPLVSGDRAYLFTIIPSGTEEREKLEIIDISDPDVPAELGSIGLPDAWSFFEDLQGAPLSYMLVNNYLYWFITNLSDPPLIEIFDLSVP
jgi:hypothetical protein